MSKHPLHKTTDKDLQVEVARAEALFNSIGEAVIATDENGKIMRINEATLDLFACTKEDLVGRKYMNTIAAFDLNGKPLDPLDRPIMRALLEGRRITETIQYRRKNGVRFPAHVTVSPIMLKNMPIGTIQVVRDITRELEIDRAKTEFVSLASHQLRTPLTAMRWYLELLLKGKMGELKPVQKDSMRQVYDVNLRLIDMVGALLSVARIEIGTLDVSPEESDIRELARQVVVEMKPSIIDKNIKFSENYDPDIPVICLDQDLTRIIFQNLLSNAVKYTPDGGSVSLDVVREKNHILIKVADTGHGIPKHQQRQLFTKMFRADNARQSDTDGTGLGLYIVKSIVKNSHGKIWFESTEHVGTTFYVNIPLKGMQSTHGEDE